MYFRNHAGLSALLLAVLGDAPDCVEALLNAGTYAGHDACGLDSRWNACYGRCSVFAGLFTGEV